jgi:signal transduction histidine kinase
MPLVYVQIDGGRIEQLAILAHELRGPLAAIDLAVNILEGRAPDSSTVDQARMLIKRHCATQRIASDQKLLDRIPRQSRSIIESAFRLQGHESKTSCICLHKTGAWSPTHSR